MRIPKTIPACFLRAPTIRKSTYLLFSRASPGKIASAPTISRPWAENLTLTLHVFTLSVVAVGLINYMYEEYLKIPRLERERQLYEAMLPHTKKAVGLELKREPSKEDYKQALLHYMRAIEAADRLNLEDMDTRPFLYYNEVLLKIAMLHEQIGDFSRASEFYYELAEHYHGRIAERYEQDIYERGDLLQKSLLVAIRYSLLNLHEPEKTRLFLARRLHQTFQEVAYRLGSTLAMPTEDEFQNGFGDFSVRRLITDKGPFIDFFNSIPQSLKIVPSETDIRFYLRPDLYIYSPFEVQYLAAKDLHMYLSLISEPEASVSHLVDPFVLSAHGTSLTASVIRANTATALYSILPNPTVVDASAANFLTRLHKELHFSPELSREAVRSYLWIVHQCANMGLKTYSEYFLELARKNYNQMKALGLTRELNIVEEGLKDGTLGRTIVVGLNRLPPGDSELTL